MFPSKFICWTVLCFLSVRNGECDKIVGGYEARPHSAPYIAHLDRYSSYFCCGTLIHESWVLSAAHCHYEPDQFKVIIGDHDRSIVEGTEQTIQAVLALNHELYNPMITDNDVMMVKLEKPAIFNQYVQLALLPTSEIGSGIECLACGWGYTDYTSNTLPDRLQCVEVFTVSNTECNYMYGGEVKKTMLCAESAGKDACNGDSGGPLMCGNLLHGVTSTGFGCAYPHFPGIYARVTEFTSWIQMIMEYS
ncbi:trypsin-3-like [Styela clava]